MNTSPHSVHAPSTAFAGESEQEKTREKVRLRPGSLCGPFMIESRIGSGGMGTIYRASRADDLNLRIALKLLDRWSDDSIDRFKSECQILSGLEHPGIAHLIDAGVRPNGQPWMAMEFVPGENLDTYLHEHKPGLNKRLEIFLKICDALSYAHSQMIIHRDLKPNNIVISRDGTPKLLDFGVATYLDPHTGHQTGVTRLQERLMTPEYASPEQVQGDRLSALSDVYSLGILLYEILTGQRPYQIPSLKPLDLIEAVTKSPIARPSSVAAASDEVHVSFASRLRGDIDTIVLKSLERPLENRYSSVAALASDIQLHLKGLPIAARSPTLFYRGSKFLMRNKLALSTGSILAVFLISFAIYAQIQRQIVLIERDRARMEHQTAEAVTEFLVDMFRNVDPDQRKGGTIDAYEVLDLGRQQLNEHLDNQPLVQQRLHLTLGKVYRALGRYDVSAELFQHALLDHGGQAGYLFRIELIETLQEAGKLDIAGYHLSILELDQLSQNPDLAAQLEMLRGRQFHLRGLYQKADEAYQKAETLGSLSEEKQLALIRHQAGLLSDWGHYSEAILKLIPLLKSQEQRYGRNHSSVADTLTDLALLHLKTSEYDHARHYLDQAELIARHLFEDGHPRLLRIEEATAELLVREGHYNDGVTLISEALEQRKRKLGSKHPSVTRTMATMASMLQAKGDAAAAENLARQALDLAREDFGEKHPVFAGTLYSLATLLSVNRKFEEARSLYEQALAIQRSQLGEQHPEYATTLNGLARVLKETGDLDTAEDYYRRVISIRRNSLGEQHEDYGGALNNLAILLTRKGDYRAGLPLLQQAIENRRIALGTKHPLYVLGLSNLGYLSLNTGNYALAGKCFEEAVSIRKTQRQERPSDYALVLCGLANLHYLRGAYGEAQKLLDEAANIWKFGHNKGLLLIHQARLDQLLGRYEQAEARFQEALRILAVVNDTARIEGLKIALADIYQIQGRKQEMADILAGWQPRQPIRLMKYRHLKAKQQAAPQLAIRQLREAMQPVREQFGDQHPALIPLLLDEAQLLMDSGQVPEARATLETCRKLCSSSLVEEHEYQLLVKALEGRLFLLQGQQTKSKLVLQTAYDALVQRLGTTHPLTVLAGELMSKG